MRTFFAGGILYNPSSNDIKNIVEYTDCFDRVIIYDNSDNGFDNSQFFNAEKYTYYKALINNGISKAVNYMIRLCNQQNIDFLCVLDQDSMFETKEITIMKKYIETNYQDSVAIYAPGISYIGIEQSKKSTDIKECDWVIT